MVAEAKVVPQPAVNRLIEGSSPSSHTRSYLDKEVQI